MSDPNQPKLELQISSPQALVRRMDQQLALVERLLAEADAAHALVPASLTNSLGMKMLWCPPGEFLMGSPEDEEGHRPLENQVQVQISKGFWMARTPVTQGQWQAQMGNNPSYFKGSKDLPVEQVSWDDAVEFCDKLNAQESLPSGYRYALPTEAQWEYACRAGTTTPFHFGSTLNDTEANCNGTDYPYGTEIKGPYLERTTVVGSYHPNAWGLYDMHGNVWEWCENVRLTSGSYPVLRGGSWFNDARYCRAAYRWGCAAGGASGTVGFRPALVPA
jgi:formylglycine-generating enzyme required for sulfatase activity